METELILESKTSLDEAVRILLKAKSEGKHVFCNFGGHILRSDDISYDLAYMELFGCTKKAFENWVSDQKAKEQIIRNREKNIANLVEESRKGQNITITLEAVINGLKYIAEHQYLSQEELVQGLISLGCNFSPKDITNQFFDRVSLYEGMNKGRIASGASIIVNARDTLTGRSITANTYLAIDDEFSIYHFIRVITGDKSYTKREVDLLNAQNNGEVRSALKKRINRNNK